MHNGNGRLRPHRRLGWEYILTLLRDEAGEPVDDATLTRKARRIARELARFDYRVRYRNKQFRANEVPSGLLPGEVDPDMD